MNFIVYILYSKSVNQYYIGHTKDITDRLFRHKNSGSKFTKKAVDWELVYTESYSDKSAAYSREMEIKKKKSRKYIEDLLNRSVERPDA